MPKTKLVNGKTLRDVVAKFGYVTKKSKLTAARGIFAAHNPGDVLTGDEERFARLLLEGHPSAARKIGAGIKSLCVGFDSNWKCFKVLRVDRTEET